MVMTLAWRRKDGRCRAAGRVGVSEHGCLSLLMRLLLVAGLRKAVAADSCLHGFAENMNPRYHHGDLVGRGGGNRKERLLVLETPGLFRVGPPSLSRTKSFPAATGAAQASAANSPSSISMLLDEGNMASTAWPATCHGRGPGKSISMDDPPRQGAPRGEDSTGTMMKQNTGQEKSPVQKALPMMRWMNPIKSSWGRLWRSRMKLQGKRPSTTIRTMRVLRWGKAMLAAFTETMATRQAAARPVLRHPAADPAGDMDALRKDKNKAEQLARQSAALLQRKNLEVLELQERLVQTQKEQAEAAVLNEERCKNLALKDQQLQAAMAHWERRLLQEAGAPTAPTVPLPQPLSGFCQNDAQAQQLLQTVSLAIGKLMEAKGGNIQQVLDALGTLGVPAQAAQSEPAGREAPPTPPSSGGVLPMPQPELNEVSMAEGKRKPGDDAEEVEDGEELAAASLLGDDTCTIKKGKKTKVGDKTFSPTLSQTIRDTYAINRLVNKSLRGPEVAASSSAGQQQG